MFLGNFLIAFNQHFFGIRVEDVVRRYRPTTSSNGDRNLLDPRSFDLSEQATSEFTSFFNNQIIRFTG